MADHDNIPSKTRRKKEMLALQDLGAELVELNDEQLARVALPDSLRDAVTTARRMTGFEARRRQLQYIGKLMRDVDPEPIRERLAAWKVSTREHTARLHGIERWRERLLAEEAALGEFLAMHPQADAQRLRTLIRNTLHERAAGKPPRNFRALFRLLQEILGDG